MMAEAEKADFAEVPDRCPFCGSALTNLMDLTDGTGMAWVKCLGCRAEGPKRESGVEAVDAWNGASAQVEDATRRRAEKIEDLLRPPVLQATSYPEPAEAECLGWKKAAAGIAERVRGHWLLGRPR